MSKAQYYRFIFPLTILSFLFCNISCKKSPTGPDAWWENIKSGSRNYTWHIDTITTDPFMYISNTWGSSNTDLWATNGGNVFHYDGISWKPYPGIYFDVIYGFAQNNVWAIYEGPSAKILHYNGVTWTHITKIAVDDTCYMFINDLWGSSPNNIYAVGVATYKSSLGKSFILHYDGNNWSILNIPSSSMSFSECRYWNGMLCIWAVESENGQDRYKIIQYSGQQFKEIVMDDDLGMMNIVGNSLLFYTGKKIYRYDGQVELFADLTSTGYLGGIYGRSEKDIFCGVWKASIGHFNGTDLVPLFALPPTIKFAYNGICFDSSVVFFARDDISGTSVSITGKMKK
jgi:hypothetical protein